MSYLPLLQRQIKKYLKDDVISPPLKDLLDAINRSYEHYERDHQLGLKSLEISSQELREIAQEKADKEERLRAILNAASDSILVLDESNQINEINTEAQLLFGNRDLLGKNITELPIHSKKTSLSEMLDKKGSNELFELSIEYSGRIIPVELSFSYLLLNRTKLKVCIFRDVSARKFTEHALSLRHKITHLLLGSNSYQSIFPKILEELCEELGWDSACFWEKDNAPIKVVKNLGLPLFKQTLKAPLLPNILHPFYKEQEGLNPSVLGIPVFYEDEIFGLIELYSERNKDLNLIDFKLNKDIGGEIGLFIDRYKSREREIVIQKQLVTAAQQAGMCQVATSVLHNVGNLLNSVNISCTFLLEGLKESEMNVLKKLKHLLEQNKDNLSCFLSEDPKGKKIPEFIIALSDQWENEKEKLSNEAKLLSEYINNIKSIIKMQQSMGAALSVIELVSFNQILTDVLGMQKRNLSIKGIKLIEKLNEIPPSQLDKARISQILVNLINNSIEAMEKSDYKELMITSELKDGRIVLSLKDTGIGICPEDKQNIFSFGFTTKKEGHGFGLHSAINTVREMGGDLQFDSEGVNKGSTFELTIPFKAQANVTL